jgi:arylsulfatase A-like enzyme
MRNIITRRDILKSGASVPLGTGLCSLLWISGCSKRTVPTDNLNIILMTLDTVRADHLSCYDYQRTTSPNLDRLAEKSVLYSNAIAPASWTLPSHASLFTGKFTSSHGARYNSNGSLKLLNAIKGPSSWQKYRANGLAKNETTLAQLLKKIQYQTGAVVGGPWLKKIFGFSKGFDFYDDTDIDTINGRLAPSINKSAMRWLKKVKYDNFFLFLNYFDAHSPYSPPSKYSRQFLQPNASLHHNELSLEEKIALYDAEILYMDHYIGQLFDFLKHNKIYDNTWFIVTSDHGELLGEHGKFGHGHYLYQPELHIPMFTKYPGSEVSPQKKIDPVQLTDILPCICKRLNIPIPSDIQGGCPPEIRHPIVAETYPLENLSDDGHWRAYFKNGLKYLWNSHGNHLLFDLTKDPLETQNLVSQQSVYASEMLQELDLYLNSLPKPIPFSSEQKLDKQTEKALKSLGYLR